MDCKIIIMTNNEIINREKEKGGRREGERKGGREEGRERGREGERKGGRERSRRAIYSSRNHQFLKQL